MLWPFTYSNDTADNVALPLYRYTCTCMCIEELASDYKSDMSNFPGTLNGVRLNFCGTTSSTITGWFSLAVTHKYRNCMSFAEKFSELLPFRALRNAHNMKSIFSIKQRKWNELKRSLQDGNSGRTNEE